MKELFKIDLKDYNESDLVYKRPSSRAIIIKNDLIALVYSKKYNYYKFPGGGIKDNEDRINALIREVKEEVGLVVINDSIKEYGSVKRIQKYLDYQIFYQQNYYYFCDVSIKECEQNLDEYEKDEEFVLKWVNPLAAIKVNSLFKDNIFKETMIKRDKLVLQMLVKEGYFMELLNAKFDDLKEVELLYKSVVGTRYCVWNEEYPTIFEIENDFSHNNLFVLKEKNKVIGAVSVNFENEMDDVLCFSGTDNPCEIARVVVKPTYQGKNIGYFMIKSLLEKLKTLDYSVVRLAVEVNHVPAIKLYEKCGFKKVGTHYMYEHHYYLYEYIL